MLSIAVNWGGDEPVSCKDMALYMGALVGIEPRFEVLSPYMIPASITDNALRKQIAGPCKVRWQDGFRDVVRFAHPEIEIRNI